MNLTTQSTLIAASRLIERPDVTPDGAAALVRELADVATFLVHGDGGEATWFSDPVAAVTGYALDDLTGRGYLRYLDEARNAGYFSAREAAFATGGAVFHRVLITPKTGPVVPAWIANIPLPQTQRLIAYFVD